MTKPETLPWGRYERLRPDQIDAILAAAPIAYLPWGALEWHSYHNPIGLDGMQAYGQCCALAEQTGGVVLPAVYVGTDTIKGFKGFAHTIEHRPDTIRALCLDFLEQLADEGYRVIVIVSGHMGEGQLRTLREAAGTFEKRVPGVEVLLCSSFDPVEDVFRANHAARGETSLQLHLDPEPVDLSRLPADRKTTLDGDGVWGEDPRLATAEEGSRILALFVERMLPDIRKLIERTTT